MPFWLVSSVQSRPWGKASGPSTGALEAQGSGSGQAGRVRLSWLQREKSSTLLNLRTGHGDHGDDYSLHPEQPSLWGVVQTQAFPVSL